MKKKLHTLFTFLCLCMIVPSFGQRTLFLKLEGIEGDAIHKDYKGWIEVTGLEQSTSSTIASSPSGGATVGKVKFGEFKIRKEIDKASPLLLLNTATGKRIRQGILAFDGFDLTATYTITLSDVVITGVNTSSECTPYCLTTEQVSLYFAKAEWVYKDKNGAITKGSWDITKNRP